MRKPKLTEEEKKERARESNRKQRERAKADPELAARRKEHNRKHREKVKADPALAAREKAMNKARRLKLLANPEYAAQHKERRRVSSKRYISENYEKIRASTGRYQAKNKEKITEYRKGYKKRKRLDPVHRAKTLEYNREYFSRPDVRARKNAARNQSWPEQMKNPVNKMLHLARGKISEIRRLAKLGRIPKSGRSRFADYFGAEPEIVLQHLSSLFSPEMNWENWGPVWHVDHIIPISSGTKSIELIAKLNHYKNLRPLLASENLSKNNKMPDFFPDGVPFTPEEVGWLPPEARQPTVGAVQVAAGVSGAVG